MSTPSEPPPEIPEPETEVQTIPSEPPPNFSDVLREQALREGLTDLTPPRRPIGQA